MFVNFQENEFGALAMASNSMPGQGMVELTNDELAMIYGGDVDWGAVGNQALGGAITGGIGGAAGGAVVGAMAGGVGAGPGAVTGGVAGAIGGAISGAGMELWNQLTRD